jgi:UDP-glucose 4-epimerase
MTKNILVTGGAGYIGSHTVVELIQAGMRPVILDTFENSDKSVLAGIKSLTDQDVTVYEGSYTDAKASLCATSTLLVRTNRP